MDNNKTPSGYREIINPSWISMEECFKQWNVVDGYHTYGVIDELRKISVDKLKEFVKEYKESTGEDDNARTMEAWYDCFGKVGNHEYYELDSLSHDELIYFIIQCENYDLLKTPSFWDILPGNHKDKCRKIYGLPYNIDVVDIENYKKYGFSWMYYSDCSTFPNLQWKSYIGSFEHLYGICIGLKDHFQDVTKNWLGNESDGEFVCAFFVLDKNDKPKYLINKIIDNHELTIIPENNVGPLKFKV